jgi:tripartite-type tricarboxylate transporter receptor subunit TctC
MYSIIVRALAAVAVATALSSVPLTAAAQADFPGKRVIEITCLFPAGSSADVTARVLAEGLSKHLDTTVIVVNRPGAGGAIGYKHVASQKPDGLNLVWNSNSISTTFHSGQLPFDYKAFDPVAKVLAESPVLVVKGDSKWKSLAEFLADAKSNPGKITLGNSGPGSHTHITAVAFQSAAGIRLVDVPYASAQVIPGLIGGHVDAVVQLPGAVMTHTKSGVLRILTTFTSQRDPALPDVPTAKEQGVDLALDAWRGIAVPKGAPAPVVAKLEAAIKRTVESPDFGKRSEQLGVVPAFAPAAEFGALIAKEDADLARIMQLAGLKK